MRSFFYLSCMFVMAYPKLERTVCAFDSAIIASSLFSVRIARGKASSSPCWGFLFCFDKYVVQLISKNRDKKITIREFFEKFLFLSFMPV